MSEMNLKNWMGLGFAATLSKYFQLLAANKELEAKLIEANSFGVGKRLGELENDKIVLSKKLAEANAAIDNLNEINETELRLRQKYERQLEAATAAKSGLEEVPVAVQDELHRLHDVLMNISGENWLEYRAWAQKQITMIHVAYFKGHTVVKHREPSGGKRPM